MKKRIFTLAFVLASCINMMAQNSVEDEITEWKDRSLAGFYVGYVAGLGMPDAMSNNIGKSMEIGFELPIWDPTLSDKLKFHLNLGFNWKNYRMTKDDRAFVKDYSTGHVMIGQPKYLNSELGKGCVDYSRMKIFSITLPLLLEYQFSEPWFVAFGPVVNFNLHGSIYTKFSNDRGERVTTSSNGLRQSVVTADLKLLFGHEDIALYGKWSPCRQLREKYAPELDFTGISFGVQAVF